MVELVNNVSGLAIALLLGLFSFRYMNFLYRIYFFQLVSYCVIFGMSYAVQNNSNHNNQWLFNLSMPIETGLLSWAAYVYFATDKKKYLVWIGYMVFLAIIISEMLIKGISVFFNYGYIAESGLLVLIYLLVLYSHFIKQNLGWSSSPEIWISIGIVLYFGGVVPYLSLMRYLEQSHHHYSKLLYDFIIEGLCTIRYLLLAVGFWLVRRNALAKFKVEKKIV
jgi:hypothetical protein